MNKLLIAATLGIAALAAGAALPTGAAGAAEGGTTYHFGTHTKHTNIAFVSEAEIETIHGTSNEMSGTFVADFDKLAGTCDLTIPVSGLHTGIDARDEHLRSDQWLDAAKFPNITLTCDAITLTVKNAERGIYDAKLKGKLTIHGVTKEREFAATVVNLPQAIAARLGDGEWVKVSARFDVKLGDHDIEIPNPEMVGPKVSETWSVSFSAFATSTPPKKR